MSGTTHTPTREMAQSAAQKAGDAYAAVRRLDEIVRGLQARVDALEAAQRPVTRRKAA